MRKCWIYMLLMACLGGLAACGNRVTGLEVNEKSDRPLIVCTLFPQYDFVRFMAGDSADVVMLLPPGAESHTYEPTPLDMVTLSEADLIVYTGADMEVWADTLLASVSDGGDILDLSQYVDLMLEEHDHDEHGHGHGGHDHEHDHEFDPHYWLDLENAQIMVEAIAVSLKALMPDSGDWIAERAGQYVNSLQALDTAFLDIADSTDTRLVFSGKFAYGYFLHRYEFVYDTVYSSCSIEVDPSVADMIRVIDYIDEHRVAYVFYEELSSGTVARRLAEETGAEALVFSTGHNVSKQEFESGITFLEIMADNLEVLRKVTGQEG